MKPAPALSDRLRNQPKQRGFTMIEVLVALVIIAVALAASIRAVGSMANTAKDLHQRLLAGWSADSVLANLQLTHTWPTSGTRRFDCPQGNLALICVETSSQTPNPLFMSVDISVYDSDSSTRLAQLVTVVANETQRPL